MIFSTNLFLKKNCLNKFWAYPSETDQNKNTIFLTLVEEFPFIPFTMTYCTYIWHAYDSMVFKSSCNIFHQAFLYPRGILTMLPSYETNLC